LTTSNPHRFGARHSFGVHCAALQVYQLAILAMSIVSVPLPKEQMIYDYFSEFASEAVHIVISENFIESMLIEIESYT
jgi:hypothetical protein